MKMVEAREGLVDWNVLVASVNARQYPSRPAGALWIINERIITVVGAILGKSDFVKRCNCTDITKNRFKHQIKNDDIFLTYISRLLPMEKTAYEFVH